MRRILVLVLLGLLLATGYPAVAQSSDQPVRESKLTLSPAAEPRPALKYHLWPPLIDQTSGDGMATYLGAMEALGQGMDRELENKVTEWYDMPAAQLDWSAVQSAVDRYSSQVAMLDKAARYKSSQWNLPFDTEGISMQLPSLSALRFGGKIIILRTRLAIHQGRFDDAVRSMQTLFAMSRHCSDGPTIIQILVGTAIAQATLQAAVEDFVSKPNAPNLYWALTSLPHPLVLTANGIQAESYTIQGTFHELKDGMDAKLTPQEWDALLRKVVVSLGGIDGNTAGMVLWTVQAYPAAKQYLRSQGMSAQQVDAMPVGKVMLMSSLDQYEDLRDETFKWWNVPFWQAWPHIQEVDARTEQARRDGRGIPFICLLPSLGKARSQFARLDKQLAAMQTIEAIRLYAAAHEGRLPAALADIQEVPVPINPMTGEPFPYKSNGDSAVLEAPSPEGLRNSVNDYRYILTIRK